MYKICSNCGMNFYYFDSPPQDECFCGSELREPTKAEMTDILANVTSTNTATVSC
jgi:hypothetical protein